MGHRTYFHHFHLESIKSNGKKSLPKVNEANDSGVGLRPPVPGAIGLQFTNGLCGVGLATQGYIFTGHLLSALSSLCTLRLSHSCLYSLASWIGSLWGYCGEWGY